MRATISLRNLVKEYPEGNRAVTALRGVDLDVYPGEVVMLMGPSGSGKTTLLSIMGCILTATRGSVVVAGTEITKLDQKQLPSVRLAHIGFVFQGFNLFPTLTARENVELMLGLKGIHGAEASRRAEALLDEMGLEARYDSFPENLSGGQKQRVAIARALAGDPSIILADEPTAALDSTTGRHVIEAMRTLAHEKGRTVVIVTHDSRIKDLADRTVRIEDGMIALSLLTQEEETPVYESRVARWFAKNNRSKLFFRVSLN
jgi:putative ABC transport system ATP-binding protein